MELDNCRWHLCYQQALADVYKVCNEAAFTKIPLSSRDWGSLANSYLSGSSLVDAASFYASSRVAPRLAEMVPIAYLILSLRKAAHPVDVVAIYSLSEALQTEEVIVVLQKLSLVRLVTAEIEACLTLIKLMDVESALDQALLSDQVREYVSAVNNGKGETKADHALKFSGDPRKLRKVLQDVLNIASIDKLPRSLQEKVGAGQLLARGREIVCQPEDAPTVSWETVVVEMEQMAASSLPHQQYADEYRVIRRELIRRSIWVGLKQILKTRCITGAVCVDVTVDPETLEACIDRHKHLSEQFESEFKSPPGNVVHLCAFTGAFLELRRSLATRNWPDVYSALMNLRPLVNDDAFALEGVSAEYELIRAEYTYNVELDGMRLALTSIAPFGSSDTTEEKKSIILMELESNLAVMQKQPTEAAQRLHSIGSQVWPILLLLNEGNSAAVKQVDINKAIELYGSASLSADSLEKILYHVRVNQILQNVCETLLKPFPTAGMITEQVTSVGELETLPQRLWPWLYAIDAYCDLLFAIESRDWLQVVNRCRKLEEIYESLKKVDRHDEKYETQFLELVRNKCREGYKTALDLKAENQQMDRQASAENITVLEVLNLVVRLV